jgi:hypothetical protein
LPTYRRGRAPTTRTRVVSTDQIRSGAAAIRIEFSRTVIRQPPLGLS